MWSGNVLVALHPPPHTTINKRDATTHENRDITKCFSWDNNNNNTLSKCANKFTWEETKMEFVAKNSLKREFPVDCLVMRIIYYKSDLGS